MATGIEPPDLHLHELGMLNTMTEARLRPERNLALELVRTTEAAAMAASRLMGFGDKIAADQAAVDAMRHVLGGVEMDGVVVIGEGEKDEAPMLYNGEQIGDGSPPQVDIAVDPIDGTTLTAQGQNGAIAVIAVAERGSMYDPGPVVYMDKIAVGPSGAGIVDIRLPVDRNLTALAKAKRCEVRDLTAVVLGPTEARRVDSGDPRCRRSHPPHFRWRRGRRNRLRVARFRCGHSLWYRGYTRRCDYRRCAQEHGRRHAGPAPSARRRRAAAGH